MGLIVTIVVGVVASLAALAVLLILGWRARSPLVFRPIVWFSTRLVNPRQLQTAGRPGVGTGIVRHVGRRSGNAYQTPVDIVADGDGFLIALPYGDRTSWLRNVLDAGGAALVHEGEIVEVDRPELVPMASVAGRFAGSDQPMFRLLRIDTALRFRRVTGRAEAAAAEAA